MPLYKVTMNYGFAGCCEEEVIEADSEEEASAMAYEQMHYNLSVGVEEIDGDEDED